MTDGTMMLVATSVRYLSNGDEASFFRWLEAIDCVAKVRGEGRSLFISLHHPPDANALSELIALFFRYDVDMRQLAPFATEDWARNPSAYWHQRVFGDFAS